MITNTKSSNGLQTVLQQALSLSTGQVLVRNTLDGFFLNIVRNLIPLVAIHLFKETNRTSTTTLSFIDLPALVFDTSV